MWAAVVEHHGGPDNLTYRQIARPKPGPGEVLLRVRYCGLNALDFFVRRGVPGIHVSLPHISGGDVVGEVVAAQGTPGDAPSGLYLVDPLIEGAALGEKRPGGMAEYVAVPRASLIGLPVNDPHPERYAALPIAYGTAHRMLFTRARLAAGETVAILGAAGGVGVACVQLAHRVGARVIACSSSATKLRRLQQLGADEVIDTSKVEFSAEIWRLTGRRGADVVVDYIGKDTLAGSVRATKAGGRIATCGASSGAQAMIDLRYVWVREIDLIGSDGWRRADLDALVGMVGQGELNPVIDSTYPLERAREAVAVLEERRCLGKVLLAVGADS